MDKKNTVIGISLILAAVGLFLLNTTQEAKYRAAHPPAPASVTTVPVTPGTATVATAGTPDVAVKTTPETPSAPEQLLTLDNGTVRASVTTRGAALKTVALLGHASALGKDKATSPVLFNDVGDEAHNLPALALSFPDPQTLKPVAWLPSFVVKEKTDTSVTLEAKRADGLVVTRSYSVALQKDASGAKLDPHLIRSVTTFRREGGVAAPVITGMNVGTLPPIEGDPGQRYLNVSAFDGDAYEVIGTDKFKDSSGVVGIGAHKALADISFSRGTQPVRWVASSNLFFAGIATFDEKSRDYVTGLFASPVHLGKHAVDGHDISVTAEATLNLGTLAPGDSKTVDVNYYVGPKEYARLAQLGDHQDKIVQFTKLMGFISVNWLCKLLMTGLSLLHAVFFAIVPSNPWNWGLSIVALTVLVKLLTWPLTGMQMKVSENMKKLQKPMAELKEKYKDNPQRLQQETMKLYKEHRVNPFAGCLPMLIQIPIFTGLYTAFQTCAELRHQPFLWFPDLSVPDVVPFLPHYIHILPILMGVTMFLNMRLTPMTNVDPNQKTIFYVMMGVFPIICYGSPAGLTTYWTVNNLLTLLQTWINRRKAAAKASLEATGTVEIIPPPSRKKAKGKKA